MTDKTCEKCGNWHGQCWFMPLFKNDCLTNNRRDFKERVWDA